MDPVRLLSMMGIIASVVVVVLGLGIFIATNTESGRKALEGVFKARQPEPLDFTTLVRTGKPNDYLVCPVDYCAATADAEAPVTALSADELRDRLIEFTTDGPQAGNITRLRFDLSTRHFEFLVRTPTMRFPDIVAVDVIERDGGSSLALYSKSIYGYSDVGKNRERLEIWLRFLIPDGADISLPKRQG